MIIEHAVLSIIEGQEEAFEASMREALPIITSAPHCFGAEVRQQVENASTYLLLVQWRSVEDHMSFRQSDLFTQWRALTHHFYSPFPDVTHFNDPLAF
jgi:heme-degrading monooxygenase HmoA